MEFLPATADSSPVSSASLEGLRTRLASARAQRGSCPPLTEIRSDHVPAIQPRELDSLTMFCTSCASQ